MILTAIVLLIIGLMFIAIVFLMFDSRPEDLKNRGLKKAFDTLLTENDELRQQNVELTDLVVQYKIKLEAKELGLPFPTIEEEERELARVLDKIKQSVQDDNAKGE